MVKNKFTITITDINGSRHFYLNQIIKKIVFYTIAFIVLFLVFSGFYIKYLDSKLSDISEKREELLKKSKELELSNSQMQKSIEEKFEELKKFMDTKFEKIFATQNVSDMEQQVMKEKLDGHEKRLNLYNSRIEYLEKWRDDMENGGLYMV